ncbi:MAG: aldehyde ferredoxin oxidoreductase family protein [Chloroflexi bacterium]|nr:aldehyde ferredoxin oxidoreductase family protein [Chloroflexota bacterium]MCL5075331.1 aldehyde ferredoxin oxidoreductase family protein [Chloroflexota bacterium]
MPYGYNGRILRVDLTERQVGIEENDEHFYRTYMGGSALGAYYLLKEMRPGCDAFSPLNILVLACSVVTGAPVSGLSRFSVTAKSPLTDAIGDSQAGGYWPAELKFAGFDAIVIKGRASSPVYLWIDDGQVEIRDAGHFWGKTTGETQILVRREVGDGDVQVACIGPAGEKLVRFASIVSGLNHVAGRTGMGAVMGSKNLKAVAVRGRKKVEVFDAETVRKIAKQAVEAVKRGFSLHELGTAGVVKWQQDDGGLPTRNYARGVFAGADKICGEAMRKQIYVKSESCYACAVRCKQVVAAEAPYKVDPTYGGPEYETLAALGSYLQIDNLVAIAKGNELCNKYGLDTISAGGTIAFAMECCERGIIGRKESDGLDLSFGNAQAMVEVLERIARREGIGDILAEGSARAARHFGKGAEQFAIESRGQELPAHMPQVKRSLALTYAVNPFGADHNSSDHDTSYEPEADLEGLRRLASLGLLNPRPLDALDNDKVRFFVYTQQVLALLDALTICIFVWGPSFQLLPINDLPSLVKAITGWRVTLWELMKVGERRTNLLRSFNAREGFTKEDDRLPERLFQPLPDGPSAGKGVDRCSWEIALEKYYAMMNWEAQTGNPTQAKLEELGLGWVADHLME